MIFGEKIYEKMKTATLWAMVVVVAFSSCAKETEIAEPAPTETYLLVQIPETQDTRAGIPKDSNDPEDYQVSSLRIYAFNRTGSRTLVNSEQYYLPANIIRFPIEVGTYDFVFLANAPNDATIKATLDGVTKYSDLNTIAFPASAFASDALIPMLQIIENVEVIGDEGSAKVAGGALVNPLQVWLDRLAARIDVTLESVENLGSTFTGISLSNIPNIVPLMSTYTGTAVQRNGTRTYTVASNSDYFSSVTPSTGMAWATKVGRIIVPSNNLGGTFTNATDATNAIVLTVNLHDKYNPFCPLRIESTPTNNYTLPYNSWLEVNAKVTEPLELNITYSPWGVVRPNWQIGSNGTLNVSQVEASITDYNGVRISFSSNMPVVKVLPTAYVGASGTSNTIATNQIFNSLATDTNFSNFAPERFKYDYDATTGIGTGYMDIIVDGFRELAGTGLTWTSSGVSYSSASPNGTYRIVLSAENSSGTELLQREVKIDVTQMEGTVRPDYYPGSGSSGYVGAFYYNNEVGERIISGTLANGSKNARWTAVADDDFIVLSTTPSFDPNVGTDNPGDPEDYPVVPNTQKGETGSTVTGVGRIYFRIGLTGTNTGAPRYGTIRLTYFRDGWNQRTDILYVRQGEEADYIFAPTDPVLSTSTNTGITSRGSSAVKFSPFNVMASFPGGEANITGEPSTPAGDAAQDSQVAVLAKNQRLFTVERPTMAGAFFQWGDWSQRTTSGYKYKAYRPTDLNVSPVAYIWASGTNVGARWYSGVIWNGETNMKTQWIGPNPTTDPYTDYFEVCPTGFRRPTDGNTEDFLLARNGPYPHFKNASDENVNYGGQTATRLTTYNTQIVNSELRMSLFYAPEPGNGSKGKNDDADQYLALPATGLITGTTSIPIAKNTITTERTYPQYVSISGTTPQPEGQNWIFGFYADGYFDRRPKKKGRQSGFVVSGDTYNAAYSGTLFYNPINKRSLFFPAAGRRRYSNYYLEETGAGYYWSATPAPMTSVNSSWGTIWAMELGYGNTRMYSTAHTYGMSLRCVAE